MNEPYLLIDLNSIFFRYAFALKGPKDLIYRVMKKIIYLMKKFKTNNIIFFLDKCKKNFRKNIDPNYKNNRPPLPDFIKEELGKLEYLIMQYNIPLEYHKEYEADDLIFSYGKKLQNSIVITTDKDLLQIVDEKTKVFFPFKKKLMDQAAVEEKYGVAPKLFPLYLALVGDSADNIPGISQVGPVRARKILQKDQSLEKIMNRRDYDYEILPKMLSLTTCKGDLCTKEYKSTDIHAFHAIIEESLII